MPDKMRKIHHNELETVVGHFLHYLSNEPDAVTGISPRIRFYGTHPVEAKLLFPAVSDDVIAGAVHVMLGATARQIDPYPNDGGNWRAYN